MNIRTNIKPGTCRFTKVRNGAKVDIPANEIWSLDVSKHSGDVMVRTFTGDVVVSGTFDEAVETFRRAGGRICVFNRAEAPTRIGLPCARIERVERSEKDGGATTLVKTSDGTVCVAESYDAAVEIVRATDPRIATLHRRGSGYEFSFRVALVRGVGIFDGNGIVFVKIGDICCNIVETFPAACGLVARFAQNAA